MDVKTELGKREEGYNGAVLLMNVHVRIFDHHLYRIGAKEKVS